jgi:hypothetical protein
MFLLDTLQKTMGSVNIDVLGLEISIESVKERCGILIAQVEVTKEYMVLKKKFCSILKLNETKKEIENINEILILQSKEALKTADSLLSKAEKDFDNLFIWDNDLFEIRVGPCPTIV